MTNELLFLAQAAFIGTTLLIALRIGKEALIAVIAAQAILTNLFVVKQISCSALMLLPQMLMPSDACSD